MGKSLQRVDVEYVRALLDSLKSIDAIPLEQMELFENGRQVELSASIIEDWKLVGMSNRAFIEMEFWKNTDFHEAEEVGYVGEYSQ